EEFKRLHDQVAPLPMDQIEKVLIQQWGKSWSDNFATFDRNPVGAASIAQVHMAELKDGYKVVVKVQRPGIEAVIREDLGVLYTLAELAERYLPEAEIYN